MDKTVKEIVRIAKMKNLTKDDLIQESECVDEYGEYMHMSLMGFDADELMSAAQELGK